MNKSLDSTDAKQNTGCEGCPFIEGLLKDVLAALNTHDNGSPTPGLTPPLLIPLKKSPQNKQRNTYIEVRNNQHH